MILNYQDFLEINSNNLKWVHQKIINYRISKLNFIYDFCYWKRKQCSFYIENVLKENLWENWLKKLWINSYKEIYEMIVNFLLDKNRINNSQTLYFNSYVFEFWFSYDRFKNKNWEDISKEILIIKKTLMNTINLYWWSENWFRKWFLKNADDFYNEYIKKEWI